MTSLLKNGRMGLLGGMHGVLGNSDYSSSDTCKFIH